jgi:hypothetical protein
MELQMTSNVVGIRPGQAVSAKEPNPAAIEVLEELLELARSGEVVGVAVAAYFAGGATTWRVGGVHGRGTIGVLEIMKTDFVMRDLKESELL